jgi:2-oxoacid:acceptor oxidoreductase delta subunit (pyruvate/2-ketoisovalerate family)
MKMEIVLEPGTSVKNKTGGWRNFKPVIELRKCIRCDTCWIFCPESCIRKTDKYEIDLDYCKGCGICANECPTKAIEMVLEGK